MTVTMIGILSGILNLVFLGVISWLISKYFQQKKQIKQLVNELGSDSLEHYLKEINKKGFEFTLKPRDKKKEGKIQKN